MLLSIAVGIGPTHLKGYDIPKLSKVVDFINLMAYDLRGPWDKVTGHHTQLKKLPQEDSDYEQLNLVRIIYSKCF